MTHDTRELVRSCLVRPYRGVMMSSCRHVVMCYRDTYRRACHVSSFLPSYLFIAASPHLSNAAPFETQQLSFAEKEKDKEKDKDTAGAACGSARVIEKDKDKDKNATPADDDDEVVDVTPGVRMHGKSSGGGSADAGGSASGSTSAVDVDVDVYVGGGGGGAAMCAAPGCERPSRKGFKFCCDDCGVYHAHASLAGGLGHSLETRVGVDRGRRLRETRELKTKKQQAR